MSAARQQHPQSDYQRVVDLMKEMGSKHGFDPIPPAQHAWQMGAGEPRLNRVWAWLCAHTIHFGHRTAFAVDREGKELHLEHVAADLGLDDANARAVWREGVQKGLWRNGTKTEGPRKLYLCGEVIPTGTTEGEETENEKVCTNLLPPYILKQLKELTPEVQGEFLREHEADCALEKLALAETVAGVRALFTQRQDTRFQRYGIRKIREDHNKKFGAPKQAEVRQARLQALLPTLEGFVQTLAPTVQTSPESLHSGQNGSAQTPATLLPSEPQREKPESVAGGNSDAVSGPAKPLPFEGKKSPNQLPASRKPSEARSPKPETPEQRSERRTKLPELETQEEREAEQLLFSEISRMRQMYPATDFGAADFSLERECDRIIARRILRTVGAENLTQFLLTVIANFKGIDRNSLGKQAPRAPGMPRGPRGIGLIVTWADDFQRRLTEAAKPALPAPEIRRREIQACTEILRATSVQGVNSLTAALRDYAIELLRLYGVTLGPKEVTHA
jgi:hypothetical protein